MSSYNHWIFCGKRSAHTWHSVLPTLQTRLVALFLKSSCGDKSGGFFRASGGKWGLYCKSIIVYRNLICGSSCGGVAPLSSHRVQTAGMRAACSHPPPTSTTHLTVRLCVYSVMRFTQSNGINRVSWKRCCIWKYISVGICIIFLLSDKRLTSNKDTIFRPSLFVSDTTFKSCS